MKAVILERRGEWAAALREDGTVVKTKVPGRVGETVELTAEITPFPTSTRRWVRSAIAAVLALALVGGSAAYYTTAMAASYVSVDVGDSSVELSVNRLGNVIAVTALNEESTELAETLAAEVKNAKVDEAVDKTMLRLQEQGSLDEGEDVIVGVTGENERRGEELSQAVERGMEKTRQLHRKDTKFYTVEGTRSDRNEAMDKGMSPGRFFAENDYLDAKREGELSPKATPPAWMDPEKGPEGTPPAPNSPQPRETEASAVATVTVSEEPAESESAAVSEPPATSERPAVSERLVMSPPPASTPARETSQPTPVPSERAVAPTPGNEPTRPTPAPAEESFEPRETPGGQSESPAPWESQPGEPWPGESETPNNQEPSPTPGMGEPPAESGPPVESRAPEDSPAPSQNQTPGGLIPGGLQPQNTPAASEPVQSNTPIPSQGNEDSPSPSPVSSVPPVEPSQAPANQDPTPAQDPGDPGLPPGVQEGGGPGNGGEPVSRPFPGRQN